MSAHTPGPWRFEPAPHRAHWILGVTSVALTTMPNEANARLIAAAPALLVALESMVERFDGFVEHDGSTLSIDMARAAIAKAKGGG